MFGLGSKNIGTDFGTVNTLVYMEGKGIVLCEPSAVAKNTQTDEVISVGSEAKEMIGRTPGTIRAIHPMENGVIADYDTIAAVLKYFMEKTVGNSEPAVMICVPSGATEVEKRAVTDAARVAGAREAYVIKKLFATAIGAGLPVMDPIGSMVADIGGGTTDVVTISLGGIASSRSTHQAGNKFNSSILSHIHQKSSLLAGERTVEDIKTQIGFVSVEKAKEIESMNVRGRDLIIGLPKPAGVNAVDVVEAIQEVVQDIIVAIKETLKETSPEIVVDVIDRGIVLTGGDALFKSLSEVISEATKVPVFIAQDPLDCVAIGTGEFLKNIEVMQRAHK